MDLFTKDYSSYTSEPLSPDNTLTPFTNYAEATESRGAMGCCNSGNMSKIVMELQVMFRRKRPHAPQFVYDIVRKISLKTYTDLIGCNIDGDTRFPLLPCFSFFSEPKVGDIIMTWKYINYLTFCDLQYRLLLKIFFKNIKLVLRDMGGKRYHLILFVTFE